MTRCDSAHMLAQSARALNASRGNGPLGFSCEQMADHIRQVRAGTCTLDQFADFYMIRPVALNAVASS